MKKDVLKVLAVALVLSLMISLSACGGNDSTAGSSDGDTAGEAQGTEGGASSEGNDSLGSTELFAITESDIKTQERNNVMSYLNVDGEKRTELLAAVASLKENESVDLLIGIGKLTSCNIQTPGDGGTYNVNLFITGTEADYKKLTDQYKTFGGEVVFESATSLVMDFDWGRLNSCRFSEDLGQIQVSFAIS